MKPINFKKKLLISSMLLATLGLSACGGGGSSDSKSSTNVQMSGAVVDDFVAYSFIYVDVNNNQKFDQAFEPYAYTDKDGYFSVAKDGTNYCALNPKTDYNYKYCLQGDASLKSGGVMRVEAGRDTLTTQVYEAAMSLIMNGDSESLRVTALTSGVEAINNTALINAAKTQLNLTDDDITTLQANFGTYLSGYLNPSTASNATRTTRGTNDSLSIDLNKVDPLELDPTNNKLSETDRAFKLAIQMHKLVEAIAAKITAGVVETTTTTTITTTTTTTTTKVSDALKPKDINGIVYFSIIKNLSLTSSTLDALNQLTTATVMNNVIADAVSLAKTLYPKFAVDKTTNTNNVTIAIVGIKTPLSTDFNTLNQYLNCTLSNSGDTAIDVAQLDTAYGGSCGTILEANNTNARNKLYASELGTKGVIKSATNLVTTFNQSQVVATSDFTGNIQTNDFVTASQNVNLGNSAIAPTVSFDDVLTQFETKHLLLNDSGDSGKDKFAIYFSNAASKAGDVVVCQQETNGTKNLFKGKWLQDETKNYLLNIQYLNQPITLKRLDATASSNNTTCGTGNQTCLVVEYPNLDETTSATQPTSSATFTNAAALDVSSPLLVNGITPPTTAELCTF
ncbi:MAG: hypothetical protein JXK16_12670 [Thiotrichales bacterium]|nr:hypothetical protein [Thiotrichales bacterium]